MINESQHDPVSKETEFGREIGRQETRKLIAQRNGVATIWAGLGMSGLIGWSIAVPVLLGALLGYWLDKHHPGPHSWTLALLAAGLVFGCWNAWNWVNNEDKAMARYRANKDE
jgi:ATP synthase protein I